MDMEDNKTQANNMRGGLLPHVEDKRDFDHETVFGSVKPIELPDEYIVKGRKWIHQQYDSDLCAAMTTTGVSEDQEQVRLSPEYQFAKIKEIMGDPFGWGASLRIACQSLVKYGSLEESISPYNLDIANRNYIADWKHWSKDLDVQAREHKKQSYFGIKDRSYDLYDSIRSALWLNKDFNRSIVSGALWRFGWDTDDGVIPVEYGEHGTPHAFKICGWDDKGLVCQLSNGVDVGNVGFFYMPRKVANKELTYGNFMFIDIDPDVAKEMHKYNKLVAYLVAYIKKLFKNI